ncbi:MAG: RNA methyltransferase [Rickettsiales bacterium]|jgi:tRNA/rRNA methyltransferase
MLTPVVILIRPQMGENIGAVARAMSNFGLEELRIVAPRDGWPNIKANEMAASAEYIINSATIFPDFSSAMADIHKAYATTARPRHMNKRVVSPEVAMQEISSTLSNPHSSSPIIIKCALVFGPERSGIENEEIILCDNIITIPTSEKNPSLNLAQASVIIGYEWMKASLEYKILNVESIKNIPAPKSDMFAMFEQLEKYLDESEYFRTSHKKAIMWKNLKNMLLRGSWGEQEIRSFRGMLRSLWEHGNNKN